jgi:hypothetical protein
MNGNCNLEEMACAQREFEGQIKLANIVIQAYAVASKNKRALIGMARMNLMDDYTAIDLGEQETDKVKCPLTEKLIIRADCLDYSGSHYEECKGCDIGVDTKNILLPLE